MSIRRSQKPVWASVEMPVLQSWEDNTTTDVVAGAQSVSSSPLFTKEVALVAPLERVACPTRRQISLR